MKEYEEKGINPNLAKSADDIEKVQKEFNKAVDELAENSEDVKEGIYTKEEVKAQPGNVLFNMISETSINILKSPAVSESFDIIAKTLGNDGTTALINLMVITMTNSAYNAIVSYDDLLKKEISRNFDIITSNMNAMSSDVIANKHIISVLQRKIGEIENAIKLEQFKNITD